MKNSLKSFCFKIFGNSFSQRFLEKIAFVSQYFMGIGSGSIVSSSGESAIFKLIKNENPIIFDVGANKGQFAQEALNNITQSAIVYSFEPSKKTFELFVKNVDDKRNKVFNIGFGENESSMKLYYDNFGSGLASLTKRDLSFLDIKFEMVEDVLIDTIDNFCAKNSIESIELLKIDVEGHELDVLNGAKGMINKIKLVMFEFGGCNIDTKTYFRDFYNYFKEYKMSIYRITPSGYLHKLDGYKEIYEQFRTTNFMAMKEND